MEEKYSDLSVFVGALLRINESSSFSALDHEGSKKKLFSWQISNFFQVNVPREVADTESLTENVDGVIDGGVLDKGIDNLTINWKEIILFRFEWNMWNYLHLNPD